MIDLLKDNLLQWVTSMQQMWEGYLVSSGKKQSTAEFLNLPINPDDALESVLQDLDTDDIEEAQKLKTQEDFNRMFTFNRDYSRMMADRVSIYNSAFKHKAGTEYLAHAAKYVKGGMGND